MGLDTSHDAWHGPYSSFMAWRKWLTEQIGGGDLEEYQGYKNSSDKKLEDLNHDIVPLLNHSDCDGELSVEECKQIARGLEDILSKIPENEQDKSHNVWYTKRFIVGCKRAIEANEPIDFH